MQTDHILKVELDAEGRLHLVPESRSFPYIYREAMEVHWDAERCSLYSPIPRKWGYERWFSQIREAAKEQGVDLKIAETTQWQNIPSDLKEEICHAHTSSS